MNILNVLYVIIIRLIMFRIQNMNGGQLNSIGIVIDVDLWLSKHIVSPLNVFPTERRDLKIIRAFIMLKMLRNIKEQDVNVIMIQKLK